MHGSSDRMQTKAYVLLVVLLVGSLDAKKVKRNTAYNAWVAGQGNCTCKGELNKLQQAIEQETSARNNLKGALETYVSELYELKIQIAQVKDHSKAMMNAPAAGHSRPSISFSAKLSYNRELQPLETVIFDTVLSNNGEAYSVDTGKFTAPLPGTYYFFSTILSGYNTKVESAIIVNDKEVARMYSGAHDAHGSGSNAVVMNLRSGDSVWVRLLYQGGTHVHGYYSAFTGFILTESD